MPSPLGPSLGARYPSRPHFLPSGVSKSSPGPSGQMETEAQTHHIYPRVQLVRNTEPLS